MSMMDGKNAYKNLTLALYVLYALAILSGGLLAIIALIINYLKRADVQGTIYASHFRWQIRSFWWYLLWNILAFVPFLFLWRTDTDLTALANGLVISTLLCGMVMVAAWIWSIYRVIRGLLALNENRPMY